MEHIVLVGLNHKVAPVEVREKLAFETTGLEQALKLFGADDGACTAHGSEAVILSTCNRLEVYTLASCADEGLDAVCRLLEDCHKKRSEAFRPYLYTYSDEEAARHLFRVAAGLDSMVVGEHQILGQVKDALQIAMAQDAAGKVMCALFRHATKAGKRARTETAISEGTTSISHVAVELARKIFGDLSACRVLLIGAGEMAELAAETLVKSGAESLSVVNRTVERARRLADHFEAAALSWDRLDDALAWADIVISSTAAPHAVIRADEVRQARAARRHRPLFLIDIAVPRDVDPDVEEVEGVYLYDIDDLEAVVENSLVERRREVPKAEAIVTEVQEQFMAWYRSLDVVPTVVSLRRQAHRMREAEVRRALRRLGGLTEGDREIIQAMAKRIVNKLLHHPTVCLKQHAGRSDGYRYVEVTRELFALDGKENE
ncbi:MAG: glutamyl-tRNA reductase [Gemmatimonadales bacterium]|jgi:glutamyl-tRNA reductase